MNKPLEKEELTMQTVPKAVNYLINEVVEMRVLLEHIEKQLGLGVDKHRPSGLKMPAGYFNRQKMASIR
jgi:hypothetical protein